MPGFLSSLPFFAIIYRKLCEKYSPTNKKYLAYRMSEFAAKQISFVLSECMLHIYTEYKNI
jgi:hypothetical protein